MKKIVVLGILFCSQIVIAQTTKILFIGNSYTSVNNLPSALYNLALSGGDTIIYDSSAPGGYTFQQHTTNSTTLSKINANNWDYVILQEQSQKPSFPPAQVQAETYPYAAQLNDLILANDSCTETVFYMTWGRKYGDVSNCPIYPPLCTFEGMQGRLRDSYVEMGNDNQALIAPVGEAFKYSRMADSTINLYSTDNSHPSIAGTYLAACTFYATIFETTPVGLSYTGGLPAAQAAFLQQIAQQTVFDSLSVWNINEFEPQASYTYNTNANNQLEVQFNNTSTNANSYVWNFGDGNGSNDMNPNHTFAADGDYVVTLTVTDGCTETIFGQTISVNLLNNLQEQQLQTLKVIQQNNLLSIVDSNHKPKQITIIDHLGRIVFSDSNLNNSSEQIETSSWSKGIYFVHVIVDNSRYTQKIIIL